MLVRKLIEMLAPTTCVGCGREGNSLCAECASQKIQSPTSACFRCERPTSDGATCEACLVHSQLARVTVATVYGGAARELIRSLKFGRGRSAAQSAASLIIARYPAAPAVDFITAVPIPFARYRERGYNQAELVARLLGRHFGLPYVSTMERSRTEHQVGRNRSQRLQAIRGGFSPIRPLAGQRILIVDDVLTTGATLNECAATLTRAGASYVEAATIARR